MADATIKRLDEMESFYDGLVTRARAELGVTSLGHAGVQLPSRGFDQYPNHHHGNGAIDPGQEELYIPLAGSAELELNGDRHRARARRLGARRHLPAAPARSRPRWPAVPRHRRDSREGLLATRMD